MNHSMIVSLKLVYDHMCMYQASTILYASDNVITNTVSLLKGAMQWDFYDFILASPIFKKFWRQTFFLLFSSKDCQNTT